MTPAPRQNWRPVDFDDELTDRVAPPATSELLAGAVMMVQAVQFSPYAQAALMFNGDADTRLTAIFAPGTRRMRAWVTRCGLSTGAQTATSISTTAGGLTTYSEAKSPVSGGESYHTVDDVAAKTDITQTGDLDTATNGEPFLLRVTEQTTPTAQEVRVVKSMGLGLHVPPAGQTEDVEQL